MKILFISPPTISIIQSVIGTTGPPLGLAYLASIARQKGHEVRIVDSIVEGLSFDDVGNIIRDYSPDIVGLTATTSMIPDAYRVADTAKGLSKDIKVIIGGPHVTFTPDITLKESNSIDYIVRGEGETVFSNLLDYLSGKGDLKNVRGISFRGPNGPVSNPAEQLIMDVDSIPEPALDLLPMKKYRVGKREFGTIVTSRGCPYNCMFCSSSLQFGKRWRGHSAERVMHELTNLVYHFGKREIEFLDDTFTLNMKRAMQLTSMMRDEGLDISWSASARVNLFDKEMAGALKNAGAHTVYFGVESGVQKTLNFMGKGITLDMAERSVRSARESGLRTLGSFILGFPHESTADVKQTIKFATKLELSFAQFTIATPYPGTRLWDIALKSNLITSLDWRQYTTLSPVMKLQNFSSQEIMKWLQKAYMKFYMRPSFLLKDLLRNKAFIFKRIIPYATSFLKSFTPGETASGRNERKDPFPGAVTRD